MLSYCRNEKHAHCIDELTLHALVWVVRIRGTLMSWYTYLNGDGNDDDSSGSNNVGLRVHVDSTIMRILNDK